MRSSAATAWASADSHQQRPEHGEVRRKVAGVDVLVVGKQVEQRPTHQQLPGDGADVTMRRGRG